MICPCGINKKARVKPHPGQSIEKIYLKTQRDRLGRSWGENNKPTLRIATKNTMIKNVMIL